MSTINQSIFLREPLHRPSHISKLDRLSPEQVHERFLEEQRILQVQLKECQQLYKYLLDLRAQLKTGQSTFEQHTELAEGFFVKTEIHNPDTFIVSLGLEDAYAELDLQEAIAFAQRREQYLNVALAKVADRLQGLQAELKMDFEHLSDLLKTVQGKMGL